MVPAMFQTRADAEPAVLQLCCCLWGASSLASVGKFCTYGGVKKQNSPQRTTGFVESRAELAIKEIAFASSASV